MILQVITWSPQKILRGPKKLLNKKRRTPSGGGRLNPVINGLDNRTAFLTGNQENSLAVPFCPV